MGNPDVAWKLEYRVYDCKDGSWENLEDHIPESLLPSITTRNVYLKYKGRVGIMNTPFIDLTNRTVSFVLEVS